METDRRRVSRVKGLVREGLRSVGPSPEIALQLMQTRADLDSVKDDVSEMAVTLDGCLARAGGEAETLQFLSSEVGRLGQMLAVVLDRLHIQQEHLDRLDLALERFGGSILEGSALERRLALIEDRLALDANDRR
jgi:hypothetical protein